MLQKWTYFPFYGAQELELFLPHNPFISYLDKKSYFFLILDGRRRRLRGWAAGRGTWQLLLAVFISNNEMSAETFIWRTAANLYSVFTPHRNLEQQSKCSNSYDLWAKQDLCIINWIQFTATLTDQVVRTTSKMQEARCSEVVSTQFKV